MTTIKTVSRERFRALTMSKHPMARVIATEVEWYSDNQENVIGSVLLDHTDQDWNTVILGRDERGLFRWIGGKVSLNTRTEATLNIQGDILKHCQTGQKIFSQGDTKHKKNKIYEAIVAEDKLNPIFISLRNYKGHSSAKEIIQEIAYAFVDFDGNFIEQFQSSGFNARLWELYIFAYLNEDLFLIGENSAYPDFECTKDHQYVFIECTTVNPSAQLDIDWVPKTEEQFKILNRDYFPIKYGSSLNSKLNKKYWLKENVKGNPLVFAIHDFHQGDSMTWSNTAIGDYLYGYCYKPLFDANGTMSTVPIPINTHEWKGKKISSGFFRQSGTENVSAVLFSNSATISKFNRMGKLAGFGNQNVRMTRIGTAYNPDPNAITPLPFSFEVKPGDYQEDWAQGLSMYHNPNASYPIDPELFPKITHHFLDHGNIQRSIIVGFHPFSSKTIIMVPKERE